MHRLYLAFLCFFRVLFGKALPAEVGPKLPEPPKPPEALPLFEPPQVSEPARDSSHGALQLLGMFQREGRLVDFLCESLDGYDDGSVGAAARDIHRGLRKVFTDHFSVEPIVAGEENQVVTLDRDFDPAKVRLVGNVNGQPPFRGTLRHHGWRAVRISMPTSTLDPTVVAPAEVELS